MTKETEAPTLINTANQEYLTERPKEPMSLTPDPSTVQQSSETTGVSQEALHRTEERTTEWQPRKKPRLIAGDLLREEHFTRGTPVKELLALLPEEGSVSQLLAALNSAGFRNDYIALSESQQAIALLALKRIYREFTQMRNADYGTSPEQTIRTYRRGGVLDPSLIANVHLSEEGQALAQLYAQNIAAHGENAIAHTCPPASVMRKLKRVCVETIESAEWTLQNYTEAKHIDQQDREILSAVIAEWRQNKGEQESNGPMDEIPNL